MNLHHVRTFATVAAQGSITAASRVLRTSQPAVSKQLAELEEAVGVVLFDRLPRGVRLTGAGEILLRHAQRMFAAESAAELELSELRGLTRGQLSVGASTTLGNYLIPAVFGAYNKAHPAIHLSLEIGNTATIHGMVLDDRLDFGLSEGFVASDQLHVEVVHEDEMVAIVSSDHPFRRRARTTVSELVRAAFISREPGSGTREVIDAALAARGAAIEPTMVLGSTEAVKKAVAAGLGVAIVSHLAIELELRTGQLFVLPVEDLEIRRALHLVKLKGKRESAAAQAFITLMRSMFTQPK